MNTATGDTSQASHDALLGTLQALRDHWEQESDVDKQDDLKAVQSAKLVLMQYVRNAVLGGTGISYLACRSLGFFPDPNRLLNMKPTGLLVCLGAGGLLGQLTTPLAHDQAIKVLLDSNTRVGVEAEYQLKARLPAAEMVRFLPIKPSDQPRPARLTPPSFAASGLSSDADIAAKEMKNSPEPDAREDGDSSMGGQSPDDTRDEKLQNYVASADPARPPQPIATQDDLWGDEFPADIPHTAEEWDIDSFFESDVSAGMEGGRRRGSRPTRRVAQDADTGSFDNNWTSRSQASKSPDSTLDSHTTGTRPPRTGSHDHASNPPGNDGARSETEPSTSQFLPRRHFQNTGPPASAPRSSAQDPPASLVIQDDGTVEE